MTHGSGRVHKPTNASSITTGPSVAFGGQSSFPDAVRINVARTQETMVSHGSTEYAMDDLKFVHPHQEA